MSYFVKPEEKIYSGIDSDYLQNWVKDMNANFSGKDNAPLLTEKAEKKSYSCYNYYGSGFGAKIKLAHFEAALKISKKYFGKAKVVDLGCADGIFLPSLAHYFPKVTGIDYSTDFIDNANEIKKSLDLKNVELFCNKETPLKEIAKKVNDPADIIFSLEVLEHVGSRGTMYEDKLQFLKDASELLKDDGIFIVSVPRMVGLSYFIQRAGIRVLGMPTEPISWKNFFKSVVLCDASDMEKDWWPNGHMGFNHKKLEEKIRSNFEIVKKKKLLFQVFYIFKKKKSS